MEMFIEDNFKNHKWKAKEFYHVNQEISITDFGKIIRDMVMVVINGKMVMNIMDNGLTIKETELEIINGKMEIFLMENGKTMFVVAKDKKSG
jgi:hypothetical protein